MSDIVAIRMDRELLKKVGRLEEQDNDDRSTIIRKLIEKGYDEVIKERAYQEYIQGNITFSKAAENANLTLWEMEQYLVTKGFKSSYSIDDLDEEIKILSKK